jgi:hypothetical protein
MAKRPLPQAAVDASTPRRVATESKRTEPPAMAGTEGRTVPINLKIEEGLARALAERAFTEGITQKQVITRALAQIGLPVSQRDLEDRSGRRWRPTGQGEAAR